MSREPNEQILRNAEKARLVLADSYIHAVYTELRQEIVEKWTTETESDAREFLWHRLRAMDAIWEQLNNAVSAGETEVLIMQQQTPQSTPEESEAES